MVLECRVRTGRLGNVPVMYNVNINKWLLIGAYQLLNNESNITNVEQLLRVAATNRGSK